MQADILGHVFEGVFNRRGSFPCIAIHALEKFHHPG